MKKLCRALFILCAVFLISCASTPSSRPFTDADTEDEFQNKSDYEDETVQVEGQLSEKSAPNPSINNDEKSNSSASQPGAFNVSEQTSRQSLASSGSSSKGNIKKSTRRILQQAQKKSSRSILDEALEYCQVSQEFWQKGELESALDALDRAYALILRVDTEDNLKLTQEKEDLRVTISRRILEIYASRHIVVNGQHKEIPMIMNKYVQAEIDLLTGSERQFFIDSYRRSGRFRPFIVEELRKNGLPEAISWLPLIESGFKARALSKARALGLWQFIASTGYRFGLHRDFYIDERLDPVKSTNAAIGYLKELHQIFGDWLTVLAAYNCGENRVLNDIRTQNINYLDNFWDLYEKLPRETARYVPRFLAVLHILNDPAKYGLQDLSLDPPLDYETVMVNREVHLNGIAHAIGVPEEDLKDLNPELRYSILPKDPYSLLIPRGFKEVLLAEIDTLPFASLPTAAFETPRMTTYASHRVGKGETLSSIAANYGTAIQRIREANNLRGNRLTSGSKLKIPLKGSIVPACPVPSTTKFKEQRATVHTVKQGDSIWNIAKRYCTTTQKIMALNNMKSPRLESGQVIKINEPRDDAPPEFASAQKGKQKKSTFKSAVQRKGKSKAISKSKSGKKYTVKKGDTLFTIAKKNNVPLENFMLINGITSQSKILPGQTLYIE